MDRRRKTGEMGEDFAQRHLEGLGFKILDRNFRNRYGELDLVYLDRGTLVFCEVKASLSRSNGPFGLPEFAVGPVKQKRVRRMAAFWLAEKRAAISIPKIKRSRCAATVRFDVIGVILNSDGSIERINLIRNAF